MDRLCGQSCFKIQQLTAHYTWHHVPSKLNPADLVSRGATVEEIRNNQQWFHGPSFLKTPHESWPNLSYDIPLNLPEQRKQRVALLTEQQHDIVAEHKHVNNYNKLLRIFTYVRWFSTKNRASSITAEEITTTLLMICRYIQQKHFRASMTISKPIDPSLKHQNYHRCRRFCTTT